MLGGARGLARVRTRTRVILGRGLRLSLMNTMTVPCKPSLLCIDKADW